MPTETVYGLAALTLSSLGVGRIFELKGRPDDRPLPLQFRSLGDAEAYGFRLGNGARRLALRFWPGPLTLVLERPGALPDWFAPGSAAVAVRVPDHPLALALLGAAGTPLAVTSANASGEVPALCASDIELAFPEAGDLLILDAGPSPGGLASTVVDGRGALPEFLRGGPITRAEVEEAWGP